MRNWVFLLVLILMIAGIVLTSEKAIAGDEIFLNLNNANIGSVLKILSDIGGVNIVPSTQVTGKVTIRLKGVTWEEALDIIAKQSGLVVVEGPGLIRVLKREEYEAEERAQIEAKRREEDLVPVGHKVITLEYSKANELRAIVNSFLSERGNVSVDQRTNSLIVTDIPARVELIEGLVNKLDKETPQISIQARILDVNSTDLSEFGVDWSSINEVTGTSITQSANRVSDVIGQLVLGTKIPSHVNLDAIVSSLVSRGVASLISEPRITTLDNRSASVFSGMEVPQTRLDEAGNTVLQLFAVGTTLTVTPHVTKGDKISLDIDAERSDVQEVPTGFQFTKQNASTEVVLSDGETAVIGGLTTEKQEEVRTGLPILMNLPLIGNAFRYNKVETRKTSLIILITPHIVM